MDRIYKRYTDQLKEGEEWNFITPTLEEGINGYLTGLCLAYLTINQVRFTKY